MITEKDMADDLKESIALVQDALDGILYPYNKEAIENMAEMGIRRARHDAGIVGTFQD